MIKKRNSGTPNKREALLKDKLWKLLLHLSLPGILGMVVVSLNSLVDAFFVSRLVGSDAFAGVSLTLPLFALNTAVVGLLSSGSAILYSRAIGKEDAEVKEKLFAQVFLLTICASLVLDLIGMCFGRPLLLFLGAGDALLGYGLPFYRWAIAGCWTSIFGLCTSGLIRAEGNTAYAMKITGGAVLINVALNPLFVGVCHLGVRGAALATILSMFVYSLLTFLYFYSGKGYLRVRNIFRSDRRLLLAILRTGMPSLFMQINTFFRQLILFRIATVYSSLSQLTVFTAIYRLFTFSAIPVFGIVQALQPVLGINFGAGRMDRVTAAVRIFRSGAVMLMLLMALPGWLFPTGLLSLLASGTVTSEATGYFRWVLLVLPMMPLASTSIVYLQATGHGKIASRLIFSREWAIFLPIIWLSTHMLGYGGIYYGLLIENAVYIGLVFFTASRVMRREPKRC